MSWNTSPGSNNPAANAWAAVVAAATSDVAVIAAGIAQMTTEGVRSDVRRGLGRVAWRLLSTASFVAGIVAFLVSHLAACMTAHAGPVRAPDPSAVSIRQSPVATIDSAKGAFVGSALSPDGTLLSTATKSPASAARRTIALQIWDVRSAGLPRTIARIPAGPVQLHFSVDAKFLLAVTPKRVLCYEIKTKMPETAIALPHDSSGNAAFSPDGKMLAVPNKAGKVYLVSLMTGKMLHILTPRRNYDLGYGTDVLKLAFSPDSSLLAISASDEPPFFTDSFPRPSGTVSVWNVATGDFRQSTETGEFVANAVAFSTDQSTVTVVGQMFGALRNEGYSGECTVVDLKTRLGHNGVYNYEDNKLRTTYIAPAALCFVGATLTRLYTWNAESGSLQAMVTLQKEQVDPPTESAGFEDSPITVDFSDDGSTIAVNDTHRILLFHAEGL